jgi:protein TonB
MGGPSLSPAAKVALFCTVAVFHAGLLAAMASVVVTPAAPPSGGAPVVNLTLVPSPRMDGRNGAQRPAGQTRVGDEVRPEPAAPDIRAPEVSRPAAVETVSSPTSPPAPRLAPMSGPGGRQGDPIRTGDAHADGPTGRTEGGGAPTLGSAIQPMEDRYAAEVIAWVERHKRSPGGRLSGVAVLRFVLDRQGRLREAAVVSAEGDRRVGLIALDALESAEPFPRPPVDAAWRTREFHVRLDYRPRA